MVSPALSLVISLLCLTPTTTGAQSLSSDVPVRMYPKDFNNIITRESSMELSRMAGPERRKLWRAKARQYYRSGGCQDKNQPCVLPYIICDSTPDLSGHERRTKLDKKLSNQTPETKKDLVALEELPFYNSDEKTCYVASMNPKTSSRIAAKICESEEKSCIVHPLMPMLKLSEGTVDTVTKTTQDKTASINIMVELSPYHKQQKKDQFPQDLVDNAVATDLLREDCGSQLREVLPSTGVSLRCQSLNELQIEASWLAADSYIAFFITPAGMESKGYREAVLQFISSLALRPELVRIEVSETQYYV